MKQGTFIVVIINNITSTNINSNLTHYFYDEGFPVILDFLDNRVTHHVENMLIEEHIKHKLNIYICYSPALGRSVLGKTVPDVLDTAQGCRPRAVSKTEGTVFPNTDRPSAGE